jgi:hypothetical protein
MPNLLCQVAGGEADDNEALQIVRKVIREREGADFGVIFGEEKKKE